MGDNLVRKFSQLVVKCVCVHECWAVLSCADEITNMSLEKHKNEILKTTVKPNGKELQVIHQLKISAYFWSLLLFVWLTRL